MPKKPMVQRVLRVPEELWERAKVRADEKGETVSEAVRKFLERYVPMTPTDFLHEEPPKLLNAGDPEPPEGTVVLDDLGIYWVRDDQHGVYGGKIRWSKRDYNDDPETWIKVAGNYGPVMVVDARSGTPNSDPFRFAPETQAAIAAAESWEQIGRIIDAAPTGTSEDVEALDPDRPYASLTFAEVLDDYVLVRGDLSAEYARKQLVREHEERVRVVEGERDAAESEAVSWSIKAGRLSARAESAEAALRGEYD